MAQQLTLDLTLRPALGRDDFLVSQPNVAAVNLIDQWPSWPSYGAVLVGPAGSGKSHLLEVWRTTTRAEHLVSNEIGKAFAPTDNVFAIDGLSEDRPDEYHLFHLLNHVRQNNGYILLTSRIWPLQNLLLPDLSSRLAALPVAKIYPPDDALLRGVLVKQFSDRQIAIDESLISYLLSRMPRSMDMARQIVARIDEKALEHRAEVTRQLVGKVLQEFEFPQLI